jgi:hypothetical protein
MYSVKLSRAYMQVLQIFRPSIQKLTAYLKIVESKFYQFVGVIFVSPLCFFRSIVFYFKQGLASSLLRVDSFGSKLLVRKYLNFQPHHLEGILIRDSDIVSGLPKERCSSGEKGT